HMLPSVEPFGVPSRSIGQLRGNRNFVGTRGPAVSGTLSWSQVFPFCHVGCKATVLLRPGLGEYGLTWCHASFVLAALCPRLGEPLSALHDAALCFPLGEPLSVFSGRHLMTRRLVLNLHCHGLVDGRYMARKSGSKREHVFSGFFYSLFFQMSGGYEDQHSLMLSLHFLWLFSRRRGSSVPARVHGSFCGATPVEFDKYSKALYPPSYHAYLGLHYHLDSRT
ncbi:hypothetical protein HID58_061894, partial [Brassica napus]